ncbi:MAG TPA: class I SAM-dependent methyltransferase [Gaiellaceae bacterium]|nr:class I SAM-dependent methyltransferase [Gaiellaceae bacterium]
MSSTDVALPSSSWERTAIRRASASVTAVGFIDFVLDQLPPAPCRVLEVGCGSEGGLVEELAARGYETLGVDPHAPEGERFARTRFQDLELGEFDAIVAGRMLHHVHPLGESLDLLAAAAPLIVVDEFAWDRIDEAAQDWYEGQHRLLRSAGAEPNGPPSLDEWRWKHADLHPHDVVLAALRERWRERELEWLPYLHRWLGGPASEGLEAALVSAGALPAIGYRWVGVR